MQSELRPRAVLAIFILQACLDWLYVLWVRQQFEMVSNAWFTLTPLFTFFYATFTLFAIISLYNRSRLGIGLAYWIILFGVIADVLSYELAFENHYFLEMTILPLIIMNLCVMVFIALNQSFFKNE